MESLIHNIQKSSRRGVILAIFGLGGKGLMGRPRLPPLVSILTLEPLGPWYTTQYISQLLKYVSQSVTTVPT